MSEGAGLINDVRGIPKKLHVNYRYLNHRDRIDAENYYTSQATKHPLSSWMELRFLQTLEKVTKGLTISKVSPKDIKPIDVNDPQYFGHYSNFGRDEERYRVIGEDAIKNGDLMPIDLCGGMATGFGGISKATVRVQRDKRGLEIKGQTYLDIKRSNYLDIQKSAKRHFIAAEMVSDATDKDVRDNLRTFAAANNMELVTIEEEMSQEQIKKIWEKYKNKWEEVIIVPIVRQPSTLYISKDSKNVGGEYMKGHGDFYDVVKHQLKNVVEALGIKYIFSSNIDNTGALVSRAVLGYFIEQMQQEKIEAMMEAAEKYEGDKGGVPTLIQGKFSLLERPVVPNEWLDRFNGREVFPYFNTNTFWFSTDALMKKEFDLPLIVSKIKDEKWLVIESVMGHGLESLKWKALVVDRGLRFLPAKYLTDIWVGRTDWIRKYCGRLMTVMKDGKYVQKPLLEVSKKIFGNVDDVDGRIFGFGEYDSMKNLNTLIIGGEGKHFNEVGDYSTKCAVNYMGDVAIIFEYKQGHQSGTLIVGGSSDSDELTIRDTLIFVPAGQTMILQKSKIGEIDLNIKKQDLEVFAANAANWTERQRSRVVEHFFPSEENILKLEFLFTENYLKNLEETSRENALALLKIFKVTGSYSYDVSFKDGKAMIKVIGDSRAGSAVNYKSKAEEKEIAASTQKAHVIKEGNRVLVESGGNFGFVGIPETKNERAVALHMLMGKYDESYPSEEKPVLLNGKLNQVIEQLDKQGIKDKTLITELFSGTPWQFLLEFAYYEIATQILRKYLDRTSRNGK